MIVLTRLRDRCGQSSHETKYFEEFDPNYPYLIPQIAALPADSPYRRSNLSMADLCLEWKADTSHIVYVLSVV